MENRLLKVAAFGFLACISLLIAVLNADLSDTLPLRFYIPLLVGLVFVYYFGTNISKLK